MAADRWRSYFEQQAEPVRDALRRQVAPDDPMALVALSVALLGSIYPDGHFNVVTKCSAGMFEDFVKGEVDAGRTLFVRWIASEG
jgi:hypothetical protein